MSGNPTNRRPLRFFAEGIALDGDLWLPSGPGPFPGIVACSGYQGLKGIHPERFARALVPRGYGVLTFDYRGFAWSEGERGKLVPEEQVEDVRAAVTALSDAPEIDDARLGLIGWALGGGVVIQAATEDPRVHAVACVNGIGDNERAIRTMHDERSWSHLLERIEADRRRRGAVGRSELIHPFDVVRLRGSTRSYVDEMLYPVAGFGSQVTLESAEALLRFRPELHVARIAPRPLLIVHGTANDLHPVQEAHELFERAHEPKRLELLQDLGHSEWMLDDHPAFVSLCALLEQFFAEAPTRDTTLV